LLADHVTTKSPARIAVGIHLLAFTAGVAIVHRSKSPPPGVEAVTDAAKVA
jgi:hypothetical protein